MSTPRIIVAIGTRPEEIKLRPLIDELRAKGAHVDVWRSGQHGTGAFVWDNTLANNTADVIHHFAGRLVIPSKAYDCVIVQGDTATAFAAATAAFLEGVPVAHVEAGLRTYSDEPFPEEGFRRAITAFARWHFAPDNDAGRNLISEGVDYNAVYVTGNTVIDTLPSAPLKVLVTLHRRENWGARIQNALLELEKFGELKDKWEITAIRHPNWKAQGLHYDTLKLQVVDPMPHDELLERLRGVDLVVTDSGGLQEEAAHFGVPCIVFRSATERVALERFGAVHLVNPDRPGELKRALLLEQGKRRAYGHGDASQQIAAHLLTSLANKATQG